MRVFRDDLPSVKVSRLRALGEITAESSSTVVNLDGFKFSVGLVLRKFPNGGSWSLFRCPRCDRWVQVLWLLEERPVCRLCCNTRGAGLRSWPMGVRQRAEISIQRLTARLTSTRPERLNPRGGAMMERRGSLELSLRRCLLTVRRHKLRDAAKLKDKR